VDRLSVCFALSVSTACTSFTGIGGELASSSSGEADSTAGITTREEPPSGGPSSGTSTPSGLTTDDTTDSSASDTTVSEATSTSTGDSGLDPSSSTSSGDASSSEGSSSSTGVVVITCEDLMPPDVVSEVCSESSMTNAELTVVNDCEDIIVQLFWVDYACEEHPYGSAPPGGMVSVPSFETHPWRIRNAQTQELMRELPPLTGDTTLGVLEP